jgi:hypothetical protein
MRSAISRANGSMFELMGHHNGLVPAGSIIYPDIADFGAIG